MVLATAKIEDFDRFWNTFSTKGAEKRKQHGSKGAHVFRDPNESDRVWAIFDWDEAGWRSFTSIPSPGDLSGSRVHARSAQVGGVPPPARRLAPDPESPLGREAATRRAFVVAPCPRPAVDPRQRLKERRGGHPGLPHAYARAVVTSP